MYESKSLASRRHLFWWDITLERTLFFKDVKITASQVEVTQTKVELLVASGNHLSSSPLQGIKRHLSRLRITGIP